jgi:hypothetical protein
MHYIAVANGPNQIATVHKADCNYLGPSPTQSSPNAKRTVHENPLEAIREAREAVPKNFRLCGHCLKRYNKLVLRSTSA